LLLFGLYISMIYYVDFNSGDTEVECNLFWGHPVYGEDAMCDSM